MGDGETSLVPEALGTSPLYTAPDERVGVHLDLRLLPPRRQLGDLTPGRLFVGHGPPVLDDAEPAIQDALAGSWPRASRVYWRVLVAFIWR